jgi:HPt (histidine-containing phosphotransfer) domain-containing protein
MSLTPVIDAEAIANLRSLSPDDNDVFLVEIIGIFLEDMPLRIADLHASFAAGDITSFTRTAHTIKGSASNLGAAQLRAIAESLEHHSRQQGLSGLDAQISELQETFARAHTELSKFLPR